jgi:hypothetical protein
MSFGMVEEVPPVEEVVHDTGRCEQAGGGPAAGPLVASATARARGDAVSSPSSGYESVVDQQIRLARERGDFDDLPGAGKPLPGWGGQDDDLWWLKAYLRREGVSTEALLPTSLQLARQIERLPETVRGLPSEQAVREAVGELNRRIVEHLRAPSGPHVPVRPVHDGEVVRQWREAGHARSAPAGGAGSTAPASGPAPAGAAAPPARGSPAHRRRWFGRRGGAA